MNADTVQLWQGAISAEETNYQRYWHSLDAAEKSHAEKIKIDALHKRYVSVHGRLRHLLAQTLNEAPEKIRIDKTEHGKPYLVDTPEVVFNMSHSADALVIAIGINCRLGVDIEHSKSRISLPGLVNKCFAEAEIAYWQRLPEIEKTQQFYRFWTRKEAFVKATGHGISLGLNRCVINPENQSEFLSVPAEYQPVAQWRIVDITQDQNLCGALVMDKNIQALAWRCRLGNPTSHANNKTWN